MLLVFQQPENSGLKSDKSDSTDKRRANRGCTQRTTVDHLVQGGVAKKHPAGVRQLIYQTNEMPNDLRFLLLGHDEPFILRVVFRKTVD
uniref:Uncharacterized protein n=1 Tax=Burkholderia sp. M701 TaxID=326454 RepID=V5YPT2_9BURK|nr:hypothetical protein [Burkholderia sp. M701]